MKLSTRTTTCMDFETFTKVTGGDDTGGLLKEDFGCLQGLGMTSPKGNHIGVFKHDSKPMVLIQMVRPFKDGGNQSTSLLLSQDSANALRLLLEKL